MEKTVIIYASTHHGSTRRLAEALADQYDIDLIDAETQQQADLYPYDLIGFASGIDFGRFSASVEQYLETNLPEGKKVFFLYTCAKVSGRFTESIKEKARKTGAIILGEYGCRGFNTYGPWKLIDGMNKNHPSAEELQGVVRFFESLLKMK